MSNGKQCLMSSMRADALGMGSREIDEVLYCCSGSFRKNMVEMGIDCFWLLFETVTLLLGA